MWGYPEFYIPVPGGYGTEHHGHGSAVTAQRQAAARAAADLGARRRAEATVRVGSRADPAGPAARLTSSAARR